MRFYKILKAKQCGNAEGLTAYERQFVEYLKKIDIKTITGVLPLTFTAKGGTATDWIIYGNDDVGENLFDKNSNRINAYIDASGSEISSMLTSSYDYFPVKPSTYYAYKAFRITDSTNPNTIRVCFYDASKTFISRKLIFNTASQWKDSQTPANCAYVRLSVENTAQDIMYVEGTTSTAPDHYIPYQQGVGERTENLAEKIENGSWSPTGFTKQVNPIRCRVSNIIDIDEGAIYTIFGETTGSISGMYLVQFKQDDGTSVSESGWKSFGTSVSAPTGATKATVIIALSDSSACQSTDFANIMLVKGSTVPSSYVPFGYEIPIKVTKHKSYPIQWALKGKAVRDQVTSTKGNETLTWDVIGIDHDECYYADGRRAAHSVTLQLHDCFTSLQFDEREALFYAESAMPAGTYHFTLREQPWYASDVGKTFQFTLTQTLAAGSQICITNAYNAAMTSGKIKTFSDGSSTTAIETVDITDGSDGTDLGDVRIALVGQNTNSIQRALIGSNNWNNSAIRQWLNSSAAAGSVWTPKTKFDRPPSWASSTAGFLNGMDEDFVNAVGTVRKTTALNTVTDGGGMVESDEKFFLLSRSEVYGGNEVAGGEGAAYSYYADYSDLSGAGTGADTNRIKYGNNAAQHWWLRSPRVPDAYNVRFVDNTGSVYSYSTIYSSDVAPAICIPMDEVYDCNEVDIYIGDSPLTEGETVSKTSTGVDIDLFEGENVVSTSLYNKPAMKIKYK